MALQCDLKSRKCVVWDTERSFADRSRISTVFSLINSEWSLKLSCKEKSQSLYYSIDLVNRRGLTTFPPINVTTHLEDLRKERCRPIDPQVKTVSPTDKVLWTGYSKHINDWIPSFENHGDLRVVCMFHTSDGATVPIGNTTEHKNIQVSLEGNTSGQTETISSTFSDCFFNLEKLSQDLGNLLDKHMLPDVKLKVGEHTIPAHKAVLAARSEVFLAMFQSEMSESSNGVVDIKDIEPPVIGTFLKFLYSGQIFEDLSEDIVFKLYSASDKYAVCSLTEICSGFIAKNLGEENFLQVLVLADAHNDKQLKEAVARFVIKHDRLLKSDNWITFSDEYPKLANEIYRMHFAETI